MASHSKKRFGRINHRIIVLGIEFRYVVTGIRHGASECRDASPQPLIPRECDLPVAATTRILVNRHKSYLGLVRSVKMQTSAGQRLPRRIKKEEIKRRIIHRIALTLAWLTPRPAENSPA